jgi:hypothetical protein
MGWGTLFYGTLDVSECGGAQAGVDWAQARCVTGIDDIIQARAQARGRGGGGGGAPPPPPPPPPPAPPRGGGGGGGGAGTHSGWCMRGASTVSSGKTPLVCAVVVTSSQLRLSIT